MQVPLKPLSTPDKNKYSVCAVELNKFGSCCDEASIWANVGFHENNLETSYRNLAGFYPKL